MKKKRPSELMVAIVIITSLSLLYVYQQTEVFRLAYVGQKKQMLFEELLDKNSILRYNIKRNASLVHLGDRVLEVADFQIPEDYRLVRLAVSETGPKPKEVSIKALTLVSRLFGIKRQAEAKTINP